MGPQIILQQFRGIHYPFLYGFSGSKDINIHDMSTKLNGVLLLIAVHPPSTTTQYSPIEGYHGLKARVIYTHRRTANLPKLPGFGFNDPTTYPYVSFYTYAL